MLFFNVHSRNCRIVFPLFLCFLAASLEEKVLGANDKPTAPFVALAPDKSQWTIKFSYEGTAAPNATNSTAMLQELSVAKSGHNRREISRWSDNRQSESWFVDNVFIQSDLNWPKGFLIARLTGRKADDDFQLTWVSLQYYKGKDQANGHDCFVYEAPVSVTNPEETRKVVSPPPFNYPGTLTTSTQSATPVPPPQSSEEITTKVWIDRETRLPVQTYKGGIKEQFEFSKSAVEMELPADYKKEFDQLKKMYPNAVQSAP